MKVLGVMSGSSLDGLDLCLAEFSQRTENGFHLISTHNSEYTPDVRSRLLSLMNGSALELARGHVWFGKLIGEACRKFLDGEAIDLIASHGHTIFHQPNEGFTTQIGCGAQIATVTGVPAVCDFRSTDLALGGQGAPLVPFGEQHLFPDHDGFLNLGGIANISVHRNDQVIGYDLCPCAQALDRLASEVGKSFDENGAIAASGSINVGLLEKMQALPFYAQPPPRSLGREWFDEHIAPLITDPSLPLPDRMRTMVEHIVLQISGHFNRAKASNIMVTGGGAHNSFLIERLRDLCNAHITIPEPELINFKEALIFAYLGLRRWKGETNILASVTGADRDSVGGAVYMP